VRQWPRTQQGPQSRPTSDPWAQVALGYAAFMAHQIAWIEQSVPYTRAPMAKFLEGMAKAGLQ